MPPKEFHATLVSAEKSADALGEAILLGDPERLEVAARELQQAAMGLAQGLQGVKFGASEAGQTLLRRLSKVSQAISVSREASVRRQGVVDRALQSIVPAASTSTYAAAPGPYGRSARQSGAFKLLSA